MDDDDIFNSITGGNTQPAEKVVNTQINQPVSKVDDDPFGLMGLSVGNPVQPQNNLNQQGSSDFGMGLLGFGNPNPPPVQQQFNNQNNGGLNLLGNDFLGMGGSNQPSQPVVNNVQAQNNGINMNQGFNWGNQPTQPVQPPQQNGNKFLAY
jgi:hypothetical protein